MQKKSFLLLFYLFLFQEAWSQTISGKIADIKMEPITKIVVDSSYIRVSYSMRYRPDSMALDNFTNAQTILFIGKKYTRFCDYYDFKKDSLNDDACEKKYNSVQVIPILMPVMKKIKFMYDIITDLQKNESIIKHRVFLDRYKYTQPIPNIEWKIIEDKDSIIQGYECIMATCRFGGRDFIAWYAKNVELPFGPYLFSGLPGLIFKISDTRGDYVFELNGLDQVHSCIYEEKTSNEISTSRENVRKAEKNLYDNPAQAISRANLKISQEEISKIQSKPYNPLELE